MIYAYKMKKAKLTKNINYNDNKVVISVLFETKTTKEIRILMKKGQKMKEHQAPFPITLEIFEGKIIFNIKEENHFLDKGELLAIEENIPHHLYAEEDSIIRLSLAKKDKVTRVIDLAKK